MTEIKIEINEIGSLFAKLPDGTRKKIYVNTYGVPFYGFLTVDLEKEQHREDQNMAEGRITYEEYIEHMIAADEKDSEPICMFPHWNAECYVDRRDPKFGCLNCPAAKKSY